MTSLHDTEKDKRHNDLVRVLLVEDEPKVAQRIQVCLRQIKDTPLEVTRRREDSDGVQKTVDSRAKDMDFTVTWVTSLSDAAVKMAEGAYDILVLDLSLPDVSGLTAINAVKKAANSMPIIALTEPDDGHFHVAAVEASAQGHIVKDDTGYTGLVRVMRNVLRHSNAKTRNPLLVAALEATSNAIVITDRTMRIEWINPAFTQLTGYRYQEVLGRKPTELLQSNLSNQDLHQHVEQKLLLGEHWQGEVVNRHKDGSLYDAEVSISPVLGSEGSLSGYVQIQRDISDNVVRLAISANLQQEGPLKQRFAKVLDTLFNLKLFALQRKGGVFLKAKDEACLVLMVSSGSVSGDVIDKNQKFQLDGTSLCGRVAINGILQVADDCSCGSAGAHGHYAVPLVSGSEILGVLLLYTAPFPLKSESQLDTLKQIGEMMALALRQEEAKHALEKARDMAMQASLAKSEFLANMSHEIRTPMNGVLGMLDLLRETKMTTTQQAWIETAHNSAEALLEIINTILDFSKLEAGKFEVEIVDFNLIDLVDEVCALLAVRAHAKGLELNCSFPVAMPLRWRGDPLRIRQVLTNLIGNAIKFTGDGEVSVNVTRHSRDDKRSELRFEVYDTGIGISPEAQTQLFMPFSQADSATSRQFGGSGLGLSISKKLVELMHGKIGVDSVLGIGTGFWFTLPLEPCNSQDAPTQYADLSGKRILIVDDNATNRNILGNYLSGWGLQISEADSGSAALVQLQAAVIQSREYDLILLDVQMPIMDGLALAKCLAQVPKLAKTPIILLSSGDQFDLADYVDTAIVQRILKPVRQLQLYDAIANALQCNATEAAAQVEAESELPSYRNKKVLVVEDNKINQAVIIAKLGRFDINPEIAENGQAALDKLADNRYDLIFMDCQMPVMDGYTATRELRLLESQQKIQRQNVIALTANALKGEREKCLSVGMDDYLTKPIVTQQLVELLGYYLGYPSAVPGFPSQPNSANVPLWDQDEALRQLSGDHALLIRMIDLFLIEGPKQLGAISDALAAANWHNLALAAHTLKGSLSYFGTEVSVACASAVEQAARSEQVEVLEDLTNTLLTVVSDFMGQLRQTKDAKK